jgi:hypothetical protein
MLERIHKFMKSGRLNKVIKLAIDRKKVRKGKRKHGHAKT